MPVVRSFHVATDFSEPAGRAAQRAALLVRQAGVSKGELIHVLESHRVRAVRDLLPVLAGLERDLGRSAEASLREQSGMLTRQSGVDFQPRLEEGDAASRLAEGAGREDLLVIGARGSSNLRDVLLGSTAEKVVRRSESPVLVVRGEAVADYARVLVPVDFSEDSAAALKMAAAMAPGAELHLVHAFIPLPDSRQLQAPLSEADIAAYGRVVEEKAAAQLDSLLADCDIDAERTRRIMDYGHPPLVIREAAKRIDADLIVIGRHGEHKIRDWLLGSVTWNVLQYSDRDVLVVKAPQA